MANKFFSPFKLLPELIIIFIGVYGAFLLDSYKNQRQELKYQKDYFSSFLLEIKDLGQSTAQLATQIDTMIALLDSQENVEHIYQRGLQLTHNQFLIQSAFINTNFSTIGPDFLVNLEYGANLMSLIENRFKILDEESRRYAIYETKSPNFRQWYYQELVYISSKLHRLLEVINEGAIPETQAIIDGLS